MDVDLKGKLRASLLQEAVAGRLVPQDPADEPASKLLKRIKEEKERLVKEGKLKKDKNESLIFRGDDKKFYEQKGKTVTCISEQLPFEIPDSWEWCRMGCIISLLSGRDLEPDQYNSKGKGIPYMTGATNFAEGNLIVNRWTQEPATISRLGDLLITCKGTIGAMAFNNLGDMHIARQIMAIRGISVNLGYIREFLEFNVGLLESQAVSMIPGISRDTLLNALIPIPPLAEQKRIVAKIEELMPLVDEYEKAQEEFNNLNAGLKGKLRASSLQEAIAGRLVPQDPNDEPASKLLKRINPKAIPLETEQPLPQGWCACQLKDMVSITTGDKDANHGKENGQYDFFTCARTPIKSDTYSFEGESLILPGNGDIGLITHYNGRFEAYQRIYVLQALSADVYLRYLYWHMSANWRAYNKDRLYGTAIPYIRLGNLATYPVYLPPLAEQKRIVEKLERLFATLNGLDAAITQS